MELLKEWEKLCQRYLFDDYERTLKYRSKDRGEPDSKVDAPFDVKMPRGEYEVSCLVDICYGDPNESGEDGLKFKVLKYICIYISIKYICMYTNSVNASRGHQQLLYIFILIAFSMTIIIIIPSGCSQVK